MSVKLIKCVCIILCAAMILTIIAACRKEPVNGSEAESSEISADSSDQSDETSAYVDIDAIDAINALYLDEIDRTKQKISLSKGKAYTTTIKASDQYPDPDGKKLTDGVINDTFNSEKWVGYSIGTQSIILDLGEVFDNIADIEIGCLRTLQFAIGLPAFITVSVSDDGDDYTQLGKIMTGTNLPESVKYIFGMKLQGTIRARYIRFQTGAPERGWFFVDEISVNKYEGDVAPVDDTMVNDYYGKTSLDKTDNGAWSSSDADYNNTINLVSGKPYQIEHIASIKKEHAEEFYNTPQSSGLLTDGAKSSAAVYTNTAWFRFTQGAARNIYFDLGHPSAVSGIKASFLREAGPNVLLPGGLFIFGSEDGVNWYILHDIDTIYSEGESSIAKVDVTFEKTYSCRYIKINFNVVTHIYCDEIEITGKKNVSDAASVKSGSTSSELYPEKFIDPDDFMGVQNMLLSYNGGDEVTAHTTVEEYLPLVGYYNKNFELADTFFDSFLYLPNSMYNSRQDCKKLSGWKFYLDDTFAKGFNVDALNKAVGQVKNELDKPDYTASVFFSILYTFSAETAFGDIDGDGKSEDFSKIEDRKKALKWMIDEQIKRYDEGEFENLKLYGFYWYEEQITYSDPHEVELIKFTSDYLHSLGLKFIWIPWNYSPGHTEWKNLGFDLCSMQPNYSFVESSARSILYRTAETAKLMGMSIEIEIGGMSSYYISRYKEYLGVGAEVGYMNSVCVYYQGTMPGEFYTAYKSEDPYQNSVYHDTYSFAKRKYTESAETGKTEIVTPEDLSLEIKAGRTLQTKLEIDTTASYVVSLEISPKYGSLMLNGDGSFTYITPRGFDVEDYFYIRADYGYGKSEPIKVTIRVTP